MSNLTSKFAFVPLIPGQSKIWHFILAVITVPITFWNLLQSCTFLMTDMATLLTANYISILSTDIALLIPLSAIIATLVIIVRRLWIIGWIIISLFSRLLIFFSLLKSHASWKQFFLFSWWLFKLLFIWWIFFVINSFLIVLSFIHLRPAFLKLFLNNFLDIKVCNPLKD